jgi:hypothetical protein
VGFSLQLMSRMMAFTPQLPRAVRVAAALALVFVAALAATGGRAGAAEPLLPDLVADPPDNVSLAVDSSTGVNRLLLRFNGYVHNKGPGALDFRGSREKPKVSPQVEAEVERAREKHESLPQKVEEELAVPPMKVFQRLFTTGAEETNIERPHVDEPSAGEIIYVNADGHHHWHLQRVARYSLWNAAKTAEVAPAMKVGFCLEDSQHVEPSVGPSTPVYADNVAPFRDFCQQFRPNATSLFEGISPGWRDVYSHELAFQWVDVSNVLPGEYWLREDVNPLHVVKETGGAKAPAYATTPTIVPGFDAIAQSIATQTGEARTVALGARTWNDTAVPRFTIVSQPLHGKLSAVSGNQVTYTPNAGYVGPDTFTFSAADPNSQFPLSPAVATVSLEVTAVPTRSLLVGNATSTYTVGDQTSVGREEAFQFTAAATGTVEELQFRTNGTANTGVSGVVMGVFSDNGGKPGEVLGQATMWGEPPVNSWLKVTGFAVPVVGGAKYWLVALPLGEGGRKLHYNAATAAGAGTGNLESKSGGMSSLMAQSSWETYNQGPMGFQALGRSTTRTSALLVGDATSTYTVGDQTSVGREEAFQFTAAATGTVEELQFRTNGTANTGVSGVVLGVFSDSSGKPGEVLGQATAPGEPPVSSWLKAQGLTVPVVSGTKYWLVALPLGEGGRKLHYNAATAASAGTGNLESKSGGMSSLMAQSSWETYNQGPVGFQALGARVAGAATTPPTTGAHVAIAGAPASVIAGTSVQLSAVGAGGHAVRWSASAGSITPDGLFTAPSTPPVGDEVTVSADGEQGSGDRRTIAVVPAPVPQPAPVAPEAEAQTTVPATGQAAPLALPTAAVSRPEAMFVGRMLVMDARANAAGQIALEASLDGRSVGGCTARTPAGRSFTCRVTLPGWASPQAPLSATATLRDGAASARSVRPAAPVPGMKMNGLLGATQILLHGRLVAASQFFCEPLQAPRR